MRKMLLILLVSSLLLSLVGCSQPAAPTQAAAPAATAAPAKAEATTAAPAAAGTVLKPASGTLGGELLMNPYPPKTMKEIALQLTLQDANGQPVTGAKVSFDLTMPSMMMPTNATDATEVGNGVYKATVMFTMGGGWNINCLVTRGEKKDRVVYIVVIK